MGPSLGFLGERRESSPWVPLLAMSPATQPNRKTLLSCQPAVTRSSRLWHSEPWLGSPA